MVFFILWFFYLTSTAEAKNQMECRLLLNVVVAQCPTILQLLACEDETLLIRRNALLILDLLLDLLNAVARLGIKSNRLARQRLYEDLHSAAETEHQVERALLLDIVVTQRPTILELLSSEDKTLLVRRDALLVLNLLLDILDVVTRLNIKRNGLACKSLHENLHFVYTVWYTGSLGASAIQFFEFFSISLYHLFCLTVRKNRSFSLRYLNATTQPQHKVERRLLLDIVVTESLAIL